MNELSFEKLRATNVRRCESAFHLVNDWSPAEWAVAMSGENGEACNVVKKMRRILDGTNTSKDPQTIEECTEMLAKELADVVIYADLLAARCGISLGDAVRQKFNEVSERMNSDIRL